MDANLKFTLFAEDGGLQSKLYEQDREQHSPKSGGGERSSSSGSRYRNRVRPTSAHSARPMSSSGAKRHHSPNERDARSLGTGGGVSSKKLDSAPPEAAYYQLEREDLLNTCLELKKNQRVTDAEIARLKYENQRLETENLKTQKRIEKLISGQAGKSGVTTDEIRRDIEKTAIVRQLKSQISEFRDLLSAKDRLIETMQKSQKSSQLLELMAEKEEYYAEVIRLRAHVEGRDEEIRRLQHRTGGSYRGSGIEEELRTEINRLSAGYNEMLSRLAQSEKERHMERIAQEQHAMQLEADIQPSEPTSARSGKRGGGRNQVKKTYSQEPLKIKKRPLSASNGRKPAPIKQGYNGRESSPDSKGNGHRDPGRPDEDGEAVTNEEWLSITLGSGSMEPISSMPQVPPSNRNNLMPVDELAQRPVSSGRGKSHPANPTLPVVPTLPFSVGDRVKIISGPYSTTVKYGTVKSINLLDLLCDVESEATGADVTGVATLDVRLASPRAVSQKGSADASNDNKTEQPAKFKTSDQVNLVMKNKKRPGIIIKYRQQNDLYDVMLDKGGEIVYNIPSKCLELRKSISPKSIMKSPELPTKLPPLLAIGTAINARYKGSDYWYPGVIREVESGGATYAIHFDDGEIVNGVPVEDVHVKEVQSHETGAHGLPLGTQVQGNYLGQGTWYRGQVILNRGGNKYDVLYEDGEKETSVSLDRLRVDGIVLAPSPAAEDTGAPMEAVKSSAPAEGSYPPGTAVEGKYNQIIWRSAVVLRETPINKYLVRKDNGEDITVNAASLRSLGESRDLIVSCPVVVVTPGGNISGTIVDIIVDHIYDLEYTDNSKASKGREENVLSEHIRPLQLKSASDRPATPDKRRLSPRKSQPYSEGDDVEINVNDEWQAAKLEKIYLKAYEVVYDVVLNDGSSSRHESVTHDNIRHREGGQNGCSHYFTLESQVEVYDTTLASWRLATVKKLNTNGSYTVQYSNGEVIQNILSAYLRVVSESLPENNEVAFSHEAPPVATEQLSTNEISTPIRELPLTHDTTPLPIEPVAAAPLVKGSKIEARYRGQEKWYQGEIIREHPDDTVDVDYDDGERETRVKRENIRAIVPKDDLMDYLAGLSDEDDGKDISIDYGIAAPGGGVYETPAAESADVDIEVEYEEDFD